MKLQFLGTGAADWSISARRDGDFFRRYSSALVDNRLLIDPGPHIFDFAEKTGNPDLFAGVSDIIVTHSHGDHFNISTVARLAACTAKPLRLFADPVVFTLFGDSGIPGLELIPLKAGIPETVGDYNVLPCRSNHGPVLPGEVTLNFIVSRGGRSLFYGLDSGWLMYDTWLHIRKARPDVMIFECTIGDVAGDDRAFGHTSIAMIGLMLQTVRQQHSTADDCRYYVSHMARTLHGTHGETAALLAPLGVTPAYDGLTIDI